VSTPRPTIKRFSLNYKNWSHRLRELEKQMMQPYKEYFIDGTALLVHPFSPDWYVGGSVLMQGRASSIVEIGRFQLQHFTVSMKELAEWFGLEIARIVVDECLVAPLRDSLDPIRSNSSYMLLRKEEGSSSNATETGNICCCEEFNSGVRGLRFLQ
jgi:hypothetical protein